MDKLAKKRMIAIAKDTVKNPAKALLGGPSLSEAKKILKKFGVKKKMSGGIMKASDKVSDFTKKRALKAARATRIGKIAAGVAGAALLAKSGLEKLYEKRTGKKPFTKREKQRTLVDKKMGGGLTEATRRLRAQGLKNGGMCRGMGAAIRGGNFKGVR
tara:strand:+ start:235 stop:708 length:474 start_codon:yes stop_codon:yes gene_type:complete